MLHDTRLQPYLCDGPDSSILSEMVEKRRFSMMTLPRTQKLLQPVRELCSLFFVRNKRPLYCTGLHYVGMTANRSISPGYRQVHNRTSNVR